MKAADNLEGLSLQNEWKVISKISRPINATGGHFSVGYEVHHPKNGRGFLKAFDFTKALSAPDSALEINKLTTSYIWERELLKKCYNKKMTRVAKALDSGMVTVPGFLELGSSVHYIIFEWAEGGDLRQKMNSLACVDVHLALVSLKHSALGLQQLHGTKIYHQDLKPSNVLMFESLNFKIADLGRSTDASSPAEHDSFRIPGDTGYAPPEQFYAAGSPWTGEQRMAADLYQFGSLIFFLFTGLTVNTWIAKTLREGAVCLEGKSLDRDLAALKAAFSKTLLALSNEIKGVTDYTRDAITQIAKELCEPSPLERGSTRHSHLGSQYSIERYASRISNLVKRSDLGML